MTTDMKDTTRARQNQQSQRKDQVYEFWNGHVHEKKLGYVPMWSALRRGGKKP